MREYNNRAKESLDHAFDDFSGYITGSPYGPEFAKRSLLNVTRNARINYKGNLPRYVKGNKAERDREALKGPKWNDEGLNDRYVGRNQIGWSKKDQRSYEMRQKEAKR